MARSFSSCIGLLVVFGLAFMFTAADATAKPPANRWVDHWQATTRQWRALHISSPAPNKIAETEKFVRDILAPMGINVLILEVNYGFEFASHPELGCHGITKAQARHLADVCHRGGIRLIPLFNCLGHQSWAKNTQPLLKVYRQFDEAPDVPLDNKGIYCREWCPSEPKVYDVVFDLIDELIDAFDADAVHVGMDEVFLIGKKGCPRCQGKDVAALFASVVNRLHQHIVREKKLEMLMWGDRLLDAKVMGYGKWESSETGSSGAIDRIPKDIIICDWHYPKRADYPSVRYFQKKGFRVLPATWKTPDAAVALIQCAQHDPTDRMLGILFTGWSCGSGGAQLMQALVQPNANRDPKNTGARVAATIRAGLRALKTAR